MTREEAIKWLKDHHSIDLNTQDDEAHRMAIEALEQKPCEDVISRQAVIDMTGLSEWFDSSDSYNEFVIALSELPPVTPQEPRKLEQEQDKPMIEIDLYSVIKQKYIEREVLDKIRAEIEEIETYDGIYVDRAYVLQIIDKYKAESEG